MKTVRDDQTNTIRLLPDCSPQSVREAREQIVASGALGRSVVYVQLLDYLIACALDSRQPKEFDVAVDVLGRDSSFDVSRDSAVRVYIHQLRNRLEKFYQRCDPLPAMQLQIPKGQYTVVAIDTPREPLLASAIAWPRRSRMLTGALGALVVVLAGLNLLQWSQHQPSGFASDLQASLDHGIWQAISHDDIPILLVMGDYYIFGELDERGRIARMVRDFYINSRDDLHSLFMQDAGLQNYFRDLDMTYMPEGSASALMSVAPLVHATGKRYQIKMMSRVTTADLRNNHIIYIGYISALDKLNNLFFTTSNLLPGNTFDEVYDRATGRLYISTAGLPEKGEPFRDLGLLATWTAGSGNQFVMVSGTRDAGLMHAAAALADPARVPGLQRAFAGQSANPGFESFFEVFGIDRTNFDARLLHVRALSQQYTWVRE
jgi:hypothetical protein